jgi:hypothetical protein
LREQRALRPSPQQQRRPEPIEDDRGERSGVTVRVERPHGAVGIADRPRRIVRDGVVDELVIRASHEVGVVRCGRQRRFEALGRRLAPADPPDLAEQIQRLAAQRPAGGGRDGFGESPGAGDVAGGE